MNAHWFRSYHGAPSDNKWISVTKRAVTHCNACNAEIVTAHVVAIWWSLMDYASQQDDRGSVEGFDAESVADFLGMTEQMVTAVLRALEDKGLITDSRLTNWDKRQPKREDDSAERVRNYRARRKDADVTQGNAEKRSVTRGNARGEERRGEEKRETTTTTTFAADAALSEKPKRKRTPKPEPADTGEAAARDSWLTPAGEAWEETFGAGSFDYGRNAKILSPLHRAGIEPDEIGRRLREYVRQRKGKFCNLSDFKEHHGEYVPVDRGPALLEGGVLSAYGEELTRPDGMAAPKGWYS